MLILGIETSCDETSAAVVGDIGAGGKLVALSNIVASQIETHRLYGGVVPEIAGRAHIEAISGVVERALSEAEAELAARREQALLRTAEIAETEIADAKVRAKRMIAKAEADRETRMEACRNEITLKSRELESGLEDGVDRLAKAFADKLVS